MISRPPAPKAGALPLSYSPSILVGTVRFELTTPCPPDKCATRLRHAPIKLPGPGSFHCRMLLAGTLPMASCMGHSCPLWHRPSGQPPTLGPASPSRTGFSPSSGERHAPHRLRRAELGWGDRNRTCMSWVTARQLTIELTPHQNGSPGEIWTLDLRFRRPLL